MPFLSSDCLEYQFYTLRLNDNPVMERRDVKHERSRLAKPLAPCCQVIGRLAVDGSQGLHLFLKLRAAFARIALDVPVFLADVVNPDGFAGQGRLLRFLGSRHNDCGTQRLTSVSSRGLALERPEPQNACGQPS